jgi:hypothetical protein
MGQAHHHERHGVIEAVVLTDEPTTLDMTSMTASGVGSLPAAIGFGDDVTALDEEFKASIILISVDGMLPSHIRAAQP